MGTFFDLATAEGGVGFNFNILETNLVNLAIVIAVLFVFGRRFLGGMLSERQSKIKAMIADAESRAKSAAAELAEAQQSLAQAQAEAEQIRQRGQVSAERARAELLTKGKAEVEKLRANAAADLSSEQDRAIAELRQRISALALERVRAQLQERVNDHSMQERLLDRSIAQLGGHG